jgi:long-chain fatty acid transport protein
VPARLRLLLRASCALGLLLLSTRDARAQGSLQIPLQFDFLNPGARSLALGSAFIGLADDATAAFTNPAGLLILGATEVSFEARGRRLESLFLQGGRLSGPVSNIGVDTVAGARYGESIADSTGLSYLSFVLPRPKFSIAGYRHELIRLDQEFEALGVFEGVFSRELALRASRIVDITAYGGAAAYRVTPKLNVGGGVTLYTFDLDGRFNRFFFLPDIFAAPTFEPSTQITRAEQHSDTTGLGFNLGVLLTLREARGAARRGPELIQVGVVYRRGPSFEFEAFEGSLNRPIERDGVFKVPNVFGTGIAVRLTERATVTSELTWVQYESLLDGYVTSQSGLGEAANYKLDNGIEVHGGFEYVFDAPLSPALRIGAWRDPNHAVRYEVPANPGSDDERLAAYLPRRGDQAHFTFGGGLSVTRQFEFNIGADLSRRTRQVSASAVVRFTR